MRLEKRMGGTRRQFLGNFARNCTECSRPFPAPYRTKFNNTFCSYSRSHRNKTCGFRCQLIRNPSTKTNQNRVLNILNPTPAYTINPGQQIHQSALPIRCRGLMALALSPPCFLYICKCLCVEGWQDKEGRTRETVSRELNSLNSSTTFVRYMKCIFSADIPARPCTYWYDGI